MQLSDIPTKICDDSRILDAITDLRGWSEVRQPYHRLSVTSRHNYFVLQSSSGTDVAVLNTQVSNCFLGLRESSSVHYEGFVDAVRWGEMSQAWKKTGKVGILLVDINVYGSWEEFEMVGQVFSNARLYFQHPHSCDDLATYENPHYLNLTNTPGLDLEFSMTSATPAQEVLNLPQYSVSYALEDLHQPGSLRGIEVDSHIRTSLLR